MDTKEWTLMFYMASDNPLAISIVSQLKALKAAGFHHDVNVVAQFDPYAEGTPTHIFDVNLINKLKFPDQSKIGFDKEDSFVRNLIEDKLWGKEVDRNDEKIRTVLDRVMLENHGTHYVAPSLDDIQTNGTESHHVESAAAAPTTTENGGPHKTNGAHDEPSPFESLQSFLNLCQSKYPARHYMLFIVGHGVVVGNDIFLYDEHAKERSITLKKMGELLLEFKQKLDIKGATFELIGFNSCSVSSLEVAYELQGTANYMLASQGPSFVGSWPYREILVRIFKEVDRKMNDIRELMGDIFYYCIHNSADYLLAGYSYQSTLCDLRRVSDLNDKLANLSSAMITALSPGGDDSKNDAASTYVILYSHWKAQSFFDEMYIDLYDFCASIVDRCERIEESGGEVKAPLSNIRDACVETLKILAKPDVPSGKSSGRISTTPTVVTACEFVGPAYQYAHGLSIYYPWSRPSEDSGIIEQYREYRISTEFRPDKAFHQNSWLEFLDAYFRVTQRKTKSVEVGFLQKRLEKKGLLLSVPVPTKEQILQEDIGNLVYSGEGPLGGFALQKTDPWDKMGNDCKCPSVKNFPRDTRGKEERRRKAQQMPLSGSLIGDF